MTVSMHKPKLFMHCLLALT